MNGEEFDAVVISTPAWVAAELMSDRDPTTCRRLLADVNYPQVAVVVTAFKTEQIGKKLDGFGFLVPSKEKRPILGTLFHSAVFPERAPEGRQLLMTFVGGVRDNGRLDKLSDDEVKSLVTDTASEIAGHNTASRSCFIVKRWERRYRNIVSATRT